MHVRQRRAGYPIDQVATMGSRRSRGGIGVGEVVGVERQAEPVPVALEHEGEVVIAQRPVLVGEADAAVELGVAFQSGHADQDQAQVVAVDEVPKLFEAGGFQAVGLVDDEQFGVAALVGESERVSPVSDFPAPVVAREPVVRLGCCSAFLIGIICRTRDL